MEGGGGSFPGVNESFPPISGCGLVECSEILEQLTQAVVELILPGGLFSSTFPSKQRMGQEISGDPSSAG